MKVRRRTAPAVRGWLFLLACVPLCLGLALPAEAQVIKIADEVVDTVETPHPYPDGGPGLVPVWSHTFHWPDASYIAVHFSRFELAPGDVVVLTDPERRYSHSYSGRGLHEDGRPFWGLSILGDTMEVTLLSSNEEHDAYGIVIDRWAHGYPLDVGPDQPEALCGPEDFRDVECYRDVYPDEYDKARAAVRLIKNGSAHCTGWLVSCENHILTNEHCVGSQSELDSIEFQFEYKRSECDGGEVDVELQLQGGTLLEKDAGLDYALIMPELAGNDPQSTYGYMQVETELPDIGELMYIPGHPSGDPKRLSVDSTHPNDPTGRCEVHSVDEPACTGGPVPDVGYYCDTEGGSSGSAVLSADTHKVIALHHCANCPNRGVPMKDVYEDLEASEHPLPPCSTCQPVGVPQDLVASTPADNQVHLDWEPVPDAVQYHVYRSDTSCDENLIHIGTSVNEEYLDEEVAGSVTYYYRVTSESVCGAESARSDCAIATPSGDCLEPPRFDGLVSAESAKESNCGIDLDWEPAVARCGSARYNVYRSTVPGFEPGPGNLVAACVEVLHWRDEDVLSRESYYYVVRAEDSAEAGGGPCSGGNEEDNIVVQTAAAGGPDEVVFNDSFGVPPTGWRLNGEWQIGVPQGKGGTGGGGVGGPDPSGTPFGTAALGHDISGQGSAPGNYENGLTQGQFALSPPVDLTGETEVRLRFQRWLNTNAGPGDRASVEICRDEVDCDSAWMSPDAPIRDTEWVEMDLDVTDLAAGRQAARVRFSQTSDGSGVAAGWNVDELQLYVPTECLTDAVDVPPVPDGHYAPGVPMTARRGTGTNVDVSWDVERCASPNYHAFYGDVAAVASYAHDGARCALGADGEASIELPDPPAGSALWWVIVGADGATEGIHGYTWEGGIRDTDADGACGIADQSRAGRCEY
jgi:hypothetical protein